MAPKLPALPSLPPSGGGGKGGSGGGGGKSGGGNAGGSKGLNPDIITNLSNIVGGGKGGGKGDGDGKGGGKGDGKGGGKGDGDGKGGGKGDGKGGGKGDGKGGGKGDGKGGGKGDGKGGGKGDGGGKGGGKGDGDSKKGGNGLSEEDVVKILNKYLKPIKDDIKKINEALTDIEGGGGGGGDNLDDGPPETSTPPVEPPNDDTPVDRPGRDNTVNVPRPNNDANYNVPEESDERISMPNINEQITKEIEKLTSELISIGKEFLESGITFESIDYFPESEIFSEEGVSYYDLPDYNTPLESDTGLATRRMDEIAALIQELLSRGEKGSENYNYAQFVDMFTLKYDSDGKPYFKFSIELTGAIIEDLTVTLVDDEK